VALSKELRRRRNEIARPLVAGVQPEGTNAHGSLSKTLFIMSELLLRVPYEIAGINNFPAVPDLPGIRPPARYHPAPRTSLDSSHACTSLLLYLTVPPSFS
jgi:hypothetical protein